MSKQETIAAKVRAGEQLFQRINLMLDDHDFPVIMTVLTHLVAEVIDTHSDDEQELLTLLAKFMQAVMLDLKGADDEACDCPKCTAVRRAMH